MSPQPGSAKAGRAKGKSQPNKSPAGVAAPRPSDAVTPSGADEVPPSESASRIAASREQMPQDYGIPAIERSIHALDTSGVGGIGVVGSGPLHNAGDAASGSRQALSKPQSVGGSRASVSKSDLKKSQGLVMESGRVSAPVSPDDGHLGSADRFALPPLVPPPSFPPLPFNASNAPEIGSIEVILPESATAETPVAETPSTPGQPLLHTVSSRIATPPAFPSNFPPLPVDLPMTPSYFAVGPRDLARIVDFDRRQDADWIAETFWAECGGPGGIASMLRTNLARGLECIEVHKAEDKKRSSGTASGCLAKLLNRRAKVAPVSTAPKVVPTDLKRRTAQFGVNRIPPPPRPTLLSLVIGTIKEDLIVRILLAGALVILAVGTATHPATGWYEGLAILCAVGIVLGVTSLNDWIKEGKFRKMAELRGDKTAKVLRSGKHMTISHYDILAGDIVLLSVGDEVPGDGFIVSSSRLACDESPLTGEPIAVRKDSSAPFVFGGTYVAEGEGIMCITAVGRYSMGGAIQELLFRGAKPDERGDENEDDDDAEQTPLQRRLKGVALQIGKLGFTAGLITFFALAIRWGVVVGQHIANGGEWKWELLLELVNFFVIGVTVIVVAVPEGLPLAVTISLAFSMFRMVRDRCFVRHLDASETMGEATCICTDKTGTLTENRMTVVRVLCGGKESNLEESGVGSIARVEADLLGEAISVNSTAFLKPVLGTEARASQPEFVGSATEGALLVFAGKLGYDYEKLRESNEKAEDGVWPFSSKRKRMATLIVRQREGGIGYRLHVKGASEIVLGLCDRTVGEAGRVIHMPPSRRAVIEAKIREWASEGLRTLVLAYRDMAELPRIDRQGDDDENTVEQNLIFLCLAGIKDPVRKEVPAAVRACQHAGMVVRMVTGDNVLTATKIATECGILDSGEGHIAIEGPQFRSMSDAERREVLPKMRVLARSSPTDKFVLVSLLKSMGETVAVTGDGTNDAAALNEADVGFAMGISGTQIAMNASDIVILDDNFSSIVNAVRWGRNVYDGIRKFLQFQLSVNIVAILLTIVGSVVWGRAPLNSVQLLWVNLIMDSLGALALASDKPGPDILDQKPHSRHESMVSRHMWFYIASVVAYQLALLLALLFVGEAMVPFPAEEAAICTYDVAGLPAGSNWLDSCRGRWRLTVVFTTFILLQVFNELTTRQLEGELNPGRGLLRNRTFLLISVAIVGVQVLVVQFGGGFVGTVPLDWMQWLVAAAWASGLLVWIVGIRFLAKTYEVMPASRKAKKRVASDHPHPPAPAHATSSSPAAHLKPNQPSWVGEMESIKSSSRVFVRSKSSMALQSHPSPAPAMAPSPSTRRIAPEGPGDSIVEIPSAMATGHKKHIEHVSFHPDVSEPRLRSSKMSIKKSIEELAGRVFSDEAIEGLRGKKSLSKSGIPAALSKRPRGSGNLEEAALWDGEEVGMGKDGGSEV